ncbi:hypothetical protein [Aurantimonas coralicida]|uniref:hypothetical protein n=1 Tax=Aurantimonas coralicida TaxID=182270 RepID=UPI001E5761D2|nr:hypothetical protein [Aurantimonas coralicida]MCD1641432.1 hypothetical protein [Aurantimonas coralicida]
MTKDCRQASGRQRAPALIAWGAALAGLLLVSGCSGTGLPPVFGAVFGLEGAEDAPYRVGRLPEVAVEPGDRVIGQAANAAGQCIYVRGDSNLRFRSSCPDGYRL